jgi:hypothetical protein
MNARLNLAFERHGKQATFEASPLVMTKHDLAAFISEESGFEPVKSEKIASGIMRLLGKGQQDFIEPDELASFLADFSYN